MEEVAPSVTAVARPHDGTSYRHPGFTSLEVVSFPEASAITVSEPKGGVRKHWLTEERENAIVVPWSCHHPWQTFHYELAARMEDGSVVSGRITFHAQLSGRWCTAAKQREEARLAEKRRHESELREAKQREVAAREQESASSCTNGTYVNSAGNTVCKPESVPTAPSGATAKCVDGTYSFSESRSGTCSHHGGVAEWL
ncbi:MAG TPA: DUF3761 domain-containing protein [Solirubrobacteraceae bacterium]|nr:DUF3761 domain-containing protein [Solirubrobacteraceae bacterium]